MQYGNSFSVNSNFINLDRFQSISQDHSADRTSNKYSLIPTTRIINVLEKAGWLPVSAQEMKCRNEDKKGFQKHMIKFRNEKVTVLNSDRLIPQIVLTNSHDGLASFCLQIGLFRLVCSNGLVVSDSMMPAQKIRHIGYTDQAVREAIEQVCDTVPGVGRKVNDFQAIEMTPDEKGVFAMAALTAKYGEEAMTEREFLPNRLLSNYRYGDKNPTLWNTFNTVQEGLLKGGRFEMKEVKEGYYKGHKKVGRSRAVNSISENIRINQALWMLTEKMAELKGAN